VVEAVMHHIEHGLDPKAATQQAMKEVSGAVVGIALILSAVFVPVAFLGGLTGRMYQQFALTIAISVLLSAFNALSLSPALSAMFLKPHAKTTGLLGRFYSGFNRLFEVTTGGYVNWTRLLVRRASLTIVIVAAVAVGAGMFGSRLPAGFVPDEDQGVFGINVTLPPASSLERTSAVLAKVESIVEKTEGIESFQTVGGYGLVTSTYQTNFGTLFVRLKPWDERHSAALHVRGIMMKLMRQFAAIPDAIIFPFNIPTISGFGAAAGFNFLLQDRSGTLSVGQLGDLSRKFEEAARQRPEIGNIFTSFDPRYPQVKVDLDREKARLVGVPVNEVFEAMASVLGGSYVNDFNRFGRLYRVYVQADSEFRRKSEDIGKIYVRSHTTNQMIPLSTLVRISTINGTELINRFNLFRAIEFQGASAPGYASGQTLAALEEAFVETMPKEMTYTYSYMSYQEKVAPPAGPTFVLAIVFVFLLLAALYESWRLPWAVLLGSPLVALGAFFGVWLLGYDNNVYVQIGNIMLIGLAAKNAILIVRVRQGQATLGDRRLDHRPLFQGGRLYYG
jgi:HAE1 family hydrophobic/amphiphilic exporter-1